MHELRGEDEPPLEAALARLSPCDLVLVEGYKREGHPKIEARRRRRAKASRWRRTTPRSSPLPPTIETDADGRPLFDLDDVSGIADFIERRLSLRRRNG